MCKSKNKGLAKLFMLFMILVFLPSNVLVASNEISETELVVNGGKILKEKVDENIDTAKAQSDVLVESQKEEVKVYNELLKEVYDEQAESYESNYAGAYINDDDELVVQVNDQEETTTAIDEIVEENNNVVVKEVDYSYNELSEAYDSISEEMLETNSDPTQNDVMENVIGVDISETNNTVTVYMSDCNKAAIGEFEDLMADKISDENIIEYKQEDSFTPTAKTPIYSGQKIVIGSSFYSMGVRASYANAAGTEVVGFITAGHNVAKGAAVYVYTSSGSKVKVGSVQFVKVGGKVDASFVKLTNSNYSVSKKVFYASANNSSTANGITLDNSSWWWDVPEGATVYKAGYAGYRTSGKVKSKTATVSYDLNGDKVIDATMTNMIMASYKTRMGDSGGIVYHGDKSAVGIQSGVQTSSLDPSTGYYSVSYCSNIDNICELNWSGGVYPY
jgi:predicted transcriptional regulator